MKKRLVLVAVSIVAMLLAAVVVAQAGPGGGATVVDGVYCGVRDSTNTYWVTVAHIVRTPSGNITKVCHTTGNPPFEGKAVRFGYDEDHNYNCIINFPGESQIPTTDWETLVSASGQITHICRYQMP